MLIRKIGMSIFITKSYAGGLRRAGDGYLEGT